MTKISMLKAGILRMHLAFKELSVLAIDSITKDLQGWYDQLPASMHLGNLQREDLPVGARRSIYHAHLLYLGAMMLLHRRIASQLIRSYGGGPDRSLLWQPHEKSLISNTNEGVLAAKNSARTLGLLLDENGIFKRCWLVMFVHRPPSFGRRRLLTIEA